MEVRPRRSIGAVTLAFRRAIELARRLHCNSQEMATFGRVLLWTLVLVAPGGFLLVPVLAASSLHSRTEGSLTQRLRQRLAELVAQAKSCLCGLQRHWTKS